MVDIVRRKNINYNVPDVKSGGIALGNAIKDLGGTVEKIGTKIQSAQEAKDKQYQAQVQQNLKTEQTRMANEQKAFDAADKLVAADMAGRLKNDLLRWNMEQRQNNPNFIGTAEHEKRMRDEYARLANKYGVGLGEAGRAEFTTKTQNAVNEFIGNDVKWAYQQKLKQGERSAQTIAETMNQNAKLYGANGDIEGFKESYSEDRKQLADYSSNFMTPENANNALLETDKKSILNFFDGLSEQNPKLAKALLENPEIFKEIVPDEMLETMNDMASKKEQKDLNEQLIMLNAGLANTKDKKEKRKLEKEKTKLEKQLKESRDKDYSEESVNAIYDDLRKSIMPQVQKQYELNQLAEKQAQEQATADIYTMALSPDKDISNNARMSLRLQQPDNADSTMRKAYKDYIKADQDVIKNTQPTLQGSASALKQIRAFTLSDAQKPTQRAELALNTMTAIHEQPVTQEQYEEANNIIYNAVANPENGKQLENTMALLSATILDNYAELFPTFEEREEIKKQTDPRFSDFDSLGMQSGIERVLEYPSTEPKVKGFDWDKADIKSRLKYNLVRDTFASVQSDLASGDFESANKRIFAFPYEIAKINYWRKLSPAMIDQFMQIDSDGKQSEYPQFEYGGYTFQYMGIDPKTGIIKAKRIL